MKNNVIPVILQLQRLAWQFVRRRRKLSVLLLVLAFVAPLLLVAVSAATISSYDKYVFDSPDATALEGTDNRIGLVLGSGITNDGRPFSELQSRLDTAASALEQGYVDRLILSGDNRFAWYNEPLAMKKYLMEKKAVSADKLQEDFAGRSTYESCERASKVFQLNSVVLFSAKSHLPRAIYLCRQLGVEAYGIPSDGEANNYRRREALAKVKAIFNIHINGENTILGEPISI